MRKWRELFRMRARSEKSRNDEAFSGPGGPQGAPGASGPGEPGYDGRITMGDEGGAEEETPT